MKFLFIRFLFLNKLVIYLNRIIRRINNYRIQASFPRRLPSKYEEIISKNLEFKNLHKNVPAYVIVSGPSLKKQNLANLEGQLIFTVNSFYKHKDIAKINPKYVFFLDSNLFKFDTINKSNFYSKAKTLYKNAIFFLPLFRGFKAVSKKKILPIEYCRFVAFGGIPENNELNLDSLMPNLYGVGAFALSSAVYMGCNPIYLLGFDHDYLANRGVNHHFYEGSTVDIPNYIEPELRDRVPYDEEMITNYILWQNYRNILSVAKKKNIKIYNSTEGGYLDVFELKKLDYL
jgi:hypothetical protein